MFCIIQCPFRFPVLTFSLLSCSTTCCSHTVVWSLFRIIPDGSYWSFESNTLEEPIELSRLCKDSLAQIFRSPFAVTHARPMEDDSFCTSRKNCLALSSVHFIYSLCINSVLYFQQSDACGGCGSGYSCEVIFTATISDHTYKYSQCVEDGETVVTQELLKPSSNDPSVNFRRGLFRVSNIILIRMFVLILINSLWRKHEESQGLRWPSG